MNIGKLSILLLIVIYSSAFKITPRENKEIHNTEIEIEYPRKYLEFSRYKRSPQWTINPDVRRGEDGNTRTGVEVERKGENHDLRGGWSKVVRGPGKSKPTWHVGGTIKW